MSHSLRNLPREVLAKITFFLPSFTLTNVLVSCGDSTLTHKLKTGGITHIELNTTGLTQSMIDFIQALPLNSFSVSQTASDLPLESIQKLVQGLSSALFSLRLDFHDVRLLLGTRLHCDEPSYASTALRSPLPVSNYDNATWRVCDSYPRLVTLYLPPAYDSWGTTYDPLLQVEFMAGLPASLTELSLPFLQDHRINIMRMIPPNVTSLQARQVPTADLLNLTNLLSLDLNLSHKSSPLAHFGKHWIPASFDALHFPRHLTSLKLTCDLTLAYKLKSLGKSLKSLALRLYPCKWTSVKEFMSHIPKSVTDLTVGPEFECDGIAKENETCELPEVKSFVISMRTRDAAAESRVSTQLIRSLPSVEHFAITNDSLASEGLTLEHLKLFEGRLLSLSASLRLECFPHGKGPYPLTELLPRLHTLRIEEARGRDQNLINFYAIPVHITDLVFPMEMVAPESIEILESPDDSRKWKSTGWRTLSSVKSPLLRLTEVTSDSAPVNGKRAAPVKAYRVEKLPKCLLDVRNPHQSCRDPSEKPYSSNQRSSLESASVTTTKRESALLDVPSGLTELTISASRSVVSTSSINANAPTLIKLKMSLFLLKGEQLRLDHFKALVDITFTGDFCPQNLDCACPPNLTRLVFERQRLLPSFLPLPPSLTVLACLDPPYQASELSLKILDIKTRPRPYGEIGDPWNLLSDTLLELRCSFDPDGWFGAEWTVEKFFEHIFAHPSLTRLVVYGSTPLWIADILLKAPPHMNVTVHKIDIENMSDPAALAHHAGLPRGGVSVSLPHEAMPFSLKSLVRRAYRRLAHFQPLVDLPHSIAPNAYHFGMMDNLEENSLVHPRTVSSCLSELSTQGEPIKWAPFMSFLSPSIQTLLLTELNLMHPQNKHIEWPPHLTVLGIEHLKCEVRGKGLRLPPGLTTLMIYFYEPDDGLTGLDQLPVGLTRLELPSIVIDFPIAWPSQLTYLWTGFDSPSLEKRLKSLPASLKYLALQRAYINTELAKSLPAALKQFNGRVMAQDIDSFIRFAKKRGIVWVMPDQDLIYQFSDDNISLQMDALWPLPSTPH